MRVLITGGGTEEPVDQIRSICNFSTGRTASALADHLQQRGCEVTALMAERAVQPRLAARCRNYRSYRDLAALLRSTLGAERFDLVVHAAAVSDYHTAAIEINGVSYDPSEVPKIASGAEVSIHLKENPKLLDSLRVWSLNPLCRIVAFKLTNGAAAAEREQSVLELFLRAECSLVISNDLTEITEYSHPFQAWQNGPGGLECVARFSGCAELADFLYKETPNDFNA